jgi:hypothetical protein
MAVNDMFTKADLPNDSAAAMQSNAKADSYLQLLLEDCVEFVDPGSHQRHGTKRLSTGGGWIAVQPKDGEHCVSRNWFGCPPAWTTAEQTAPMKRLTTKMLSNGSCAAASRVESRMSTNIKAANRSCGVTSCWLRCGRLPMLPVVRWPHR